MPNSTAETLTLTCANCGRDFDAQFWLIVDAAERPDLLERIRAGTLHDEACPHCGDPGHMDAPLLLYRPDGEPVVLFSLAEQTDTDENQEHARQLVEMLQTALGDQWQDQWLESGIPGVQREHLPAVLSSNPEVDPQLQGPMAVLAGAGDLGQHLLALLNAGSLENARRVIEQHPDLLTPEADELIQRLLAVEERLQARQLVETWQQLLARCGEIGIDQAFAEASGTNVFDVQLQFRDDLLRAEEAEQRYNRTGDPSELDLAAEIWWHILDGTDFDVSDAYFQLADFDSGGRVCFHRYRLRGKLVDLDRALDLWQIAVGRTPLGSPDLPGRLSNLGSGLRNRYAHTGDLEDLEAAISSHQAAVDRTPKSSPDLPVFLNNLGVSLHARYMFCGLQEDLNATIQSHRDAVELAPPDSPDSPSFLSNLANSLHQRYARNGHLDDLEAAIMYSETAVKRTPGDSRDLPSILSDLGICLRDRYARTGRLGDLEEVISVCRRAVDNTLPDSPMLAGFLNNLGNGLRDRYARTGQLDDLKEAISVYQAAVRCSPPDAPNLPVILNSLAGGLSAYYVYTAALKYLTSAADNMQRAVDLTSEGSPDLPSRLNNLGNILSDRFARTGDLQDLTEAIDHWERAVATTLKGSPDLVSILNGLAGGLYHRYTRMGNFNDLEKSIDLWQRATALTPENSLDLPSRLNNQALGLHARYDRTGNLQDLEAAIGHLQRAKNLAQHGSPILPTILNNLGTSLYSRYARIGQFDDLDTAIDTCQTAVELTPSDSTDFPSFLNNLGNLLSHRYDCIGDLKDLASAKEHWERSANRGREIAPQAALISARSWMGFTIRQGDWQQVIDAYGYARDAMDALYMIQSSRVARESWLKEAQDLPTQVAFSLAKVERLEDAVVAMENGRARLLAGALEANRRDLEQLEPLGHQDLLDRYRAASAQVTALQHSRQQMPPTADGPAARLDFATLHRQMEDARNELDAAIAAIRQVPGYEDFFLPPSFEKIQRAATPNAPLVYLLTTSAGSLALVVRDATQKSDFSPPPSVEAVWLDGFSNDDLNALLVRRDEGRVIGGYLPGQLGDHDALEDSLAQALPQLGERLMKPLAAHLREQAVDSVVLVPAGRLSLLPLHAARYAVDGQDRCFLDEFSVRYAPSAGALATAHSESLRRHAPLSLAGVGNPLPDLDTGVWASQRARAILDRLPVSSSNEHLDQARQILQSLADASSQEVIRAGELMMAIIQALALGDALVALVIDVVEVAQRIPPSLNYAEAELRSVLDLLAVDETWTAFNNEATRDALWQALPDATWLHLACHGQFNPQEPLESALLLAAGTRITLRELLDRQQATALAGIRLAFLSACQTAITDYNNVPDESVGLPAGFLQAGIPAVVGTLWPVNDASTALLVTCFYELHLNGDPATGLPPQPPASALRLAQRWLRDVTNSELAAYLDGHHRLKEASERELQRMSWTLIKEARREVRRAVRQGHGDARPFEAAYHWAPFVFYGAG